MSPTIFLGKCRWMPRNCPSHQLGRQAGFRHGEHAAVYSGRATVERRMLADPLTTALWLAVPLGLPRRALEGLRRLRRALSLALELGRPGLGICPRQFFFSPEWTHGQQMHGEGLAKRWRYWSSPGENTLMDALTPRSRSPSPTSLSQASLLRPRRDTKVLSTSSSWRTRTSCTQPRKRPDGASTSPPSLT